MLIGAEQLMSYLQNKVQPFEFLVGTLFVNLEGDVATNPLPVYLN